MYKPFSPHKNASMMIVKCKEWKIPVNILGGNITTKSSNTNKPWKHEKISFHATKFEQKIQQKIRIAVIKTQLLLVKQRYQCTNTLENTKDSYFMSMRWKSCFSDSRRNISKLKGRYRILWTLEPRVILSTPKNDELCWNSKRILMKNES